MIVEGFFIAIFLKILFRGDAFVRPFSAEVGT